ncbi:MAG: hypothetical protein R6V58_10190 [Planctomycetota bacterium]
MRTRSRREFRRLIRMARARYSLRGSSFGTLRIDESPQSRFLRCLRRQAN